jgi:hypothetical protein
MKSIRNNRGEYLIKTQNCIEIIGRIEDFFNILFEKERITIK